MKAASFFTSAVVSCDGSPQGGMRDQGHLGGGLVPMWLVVSPQPPSGPKFCPAVWQMHAVVFMGSSRERGGPEKCKHSSSRHILPHKDPNLKRPLCGRAHNCLAFSGSAWR